MAFEQKPNSGALFVNQRKQEDRHPDYTGSVEVNGKKMWISAWVKSGQKGDFLSLSFTEPKEGGATQTTFPAKTLSRTPAVAPSAPTTNDEPEEDSVPF